jgi:hypothetical protein
MVETAEVGATETMPTLSKHPFKLKNTENNINKNIPDEIESALFVSKFLSAHEKSKLTEDSGINDVNYKEIQYSQGKINGFILISNDPLCGFYDSFWIKTSGISIPEQILDKVWYSAESGIYILIHNDDYLILDSGRAFVCGDLSMTPLQILEEHLDEEIGKY